jgi:hypothetical protein
MTLEHRWVRRVPHEDRPGELCRLPHTGKLLSLTVCLAANTVRYPEEGGHLWAYLNWALGLRSVGCRVIWLEVIDERISADRSELCVNKLKEHLAQFDLAQTLAICSWSGTPLPREIAKGCHNLDAAAEADLALNTLYGAPPELIRRFRRTALLDIDPGLLQLWMVQDLIRVARHDVYFTIGETVGRKLARFPDAGLRWHYTPPCVALDYWPVQAINADAPFTTISHWFSGEWVQDQDGLYCNEKREGFLPFVDLPKHTTQSLELALCVGDDERERAALEQRGWRVREAWDVTATPWDYQRYIQRSRGEFSCVKPSCVRLQNAWISDRTLCYLASGKPAVVQHTGPSRFLPDSEGLFRFRELEEAVRSLEAIAADYEKQCRLARALAEQHFDAKKAVKHVLERAFG